MIKLYNIVGIIYIILIFCLSIHFSQQKTNITKNLAVAVTLENSETKVSRYVELMTAIRKVESNDDCSKIGKVGELGCYQIRECCWIDALEHDPSIGGEYEDVIDREYAEKCIYAYWDRYATEKRLGRPVTDEDRAKIHNGGPNGYKKTATIKYWNKIKELL